MTMDLAGRLEALEAHIAHQDAAIEDLNAMILTQWRTIDALARELGAFGDRLRDLSHREVGQPEPLPPHY